MGTGYRIGGPPLTVADVLMGGGASHMRYVTFAQPQRGRGGGVFFSPRHPAVYQPHAHPGSGPGGAFADLMTRELTAEDYDRLLALDETVHKQKTASVEELSLLPSFVAPASTASTSQDDKACCICMCDIDGGDRVKRLPCLHMFHAGEWQNVHAVLLTQCHCDGVCVVSLVCADCIDDWLKINACCPIDKIAVFSKE